MPDGRVVAIDNATGGLARFRHDTAVAGDFVRQTTVATNVTLLRRPVSGAVAADGSVYVVDSYDGSVRRFDALGNFAPIAGFSASVGAISVAVGPDGAVYAGLAGGGVRKLDPATGADLGLVVAVGSAPQPVTLAWAASVGDTASR